MTNYKGQQLLIRHVANNIQSLINSRRYQQVTYELQKLSRTDPQEVYDNMQPIAADLVQWFEKISDSPSFALQELDRLFSYTGQLYPELVNAVNSQHKKIIRHLLMNFDNDNIDYIARQVKNLTNMGFDWPELPIIKKNLR